ncbi:MAG: DUF4173 domain-containing protein, partial [Gemmatimonas sp.]
MAPAYSSPAAAGASAQSLCAPSPEADLARQLGNRIWWKALICGLVADSFSWQKGNGLNLTVYALTIILSAASVLDLRFGCVPKTSARLLQLAGVFALLFSVRDSAELALLNMIACGTCLVLALAVAAPIPLVEFTNARVRDVVRSISMSGVETFAGAIPLIARVALSQQAIKRVALLRTIRLFAIAGSVAALFGTLLSSGDPVFRNTIHGMFNWNPGTIFSHFGFVLLFAWPVMGLLWSNMDMLRTESSTWAWHVSGLPLKSADVVSALVALNGVFFAFVALQARALFGGQQYVRATTGLSLADYARSGFFTLIFTSGLVVSLLLALNALLENKKGLSSSKSMQLLSLAVLAQVGVVLASSAARMTIYMNVYGASIERFYCMTIIGWLALVMIWFAVTVLRNRPARFAFGSITLAWTTVLALNIANPDVIIAQNHLARAAGGERYDRDFLAGQLSADAVPLLVNAINVETAMRVALPPNSCSATALCAAIPAVQRRWTTPATQTTLGNWT